jgi:hypothetical protein
MMLGMFLLRRLDECGPNTKPGGSEALGPASWNVEEFAGKSAQIQIVDSALGG